jgi:hypothetical protein
LLEQRHQRCQPGGADLLPRPSGFIEWAGHSLFANGVG